MSWKDSGHCGAPLSLDYTFSYFILLWSGKAAIAALLPRLCLLVIHNPSSYPSRCRTWFGKAAIAVRPLLTSLSLSSPHPIPLPSMVRYLIRESGHCGAPPFQLLARGLLTTFSFFASPPTWSGNAAIAVRLPFKYLHALDCNSISLVWESGHCGAPPFQMSVFRIVYWCVGYLSNLSFEETATIAVRPLPWIHPIPPCTFWLILT